MHFRIKLFITHLQPGKSEQISDLTGVFRPLGPPVFRCFRSNSVRSYTLIRSERDALTGYSNTFPRYSWDDIPLNVSVPVISLENDMDSVIMPRKKKKKVNHYGIETCGASSCSGY